MDPKKTPPNLPLKFLRWFLREDYLDEIEGNIIELFEKESLVNPTKASRHLLINILRHFRPEYIKLFHANRKPSIICDMILNYIKLAFRNLRKRASYSFINISGLALGVCACLLILNYIDFETSYDSFHTNATELFRMKRTFIENGERNVPTMKTTFGLGPTLKQDLPEIKTFVRTHNEACVVTYQAAGGTSIGFHQEKILIADSTFFDAFTFTPVAGDLATSLDNPNSIVLTESTWHKYFGYDDAIGKTLQLAGGYMPGVYEITAVIRDVPANSHFAFDFVVPFHNILNANQYKPDNGWAWNNFTTYVQLNDASQLQSAREKLPAFCNRWLNEWKDRKASVELDFQPLRDIHTQPGLRHDGETISRSTIYFFGLIALFILFIAWINYVNLSTARAIERSREVGIKKTIGAVRSQLITQFLFESFVINIIAIVFALLLALLLLPVLSDMTGKVLPTHLTDIRLWGVLITLFLAGTFASGIYPAVILSSFSITKAIKKQSERGFSLRKGLVVFQFVSSLVLIAGTFVVYRQVTFMQTQDTGLQMEQMLVIKSPGTLEWEDSKRRLKAFKEEAKKIAGVNAIATSGAVPSTGHNWGADIRRPGTPLSDIITASIVFVDPDFVPTYGINVINGHTFNIESASDMKSALVNEATVRALKINSNDDALQEKFILGNDTVNIIGVAKNYNWNSLKSDITPFILIPWDVVPDRISVHIAGGSIPGTIDALEKLYHAMMPNDPFEYKFLDDAFNSQYKSDQQFGNIFGMFAGLAIAICCLGLWGLASFTTSQKLREIGIRKVLGAPVASIVALLVRQFVLLIGISALISIPVAWYGMDSWLSGFAFRVSIGWELFVIPIMILKVIALFTVGIQVRRGAMMNPVDVLKSE
jgi:putative ABC transport system permease protein